MVNKPPKAFTTPNNQFLKGIFFGKYETDRYESRNGVNFSNFSFNEARINNCSKCDVNEVFLIENEIIEKKKLNNIPIELSDERIDKKYLFVEDIFNVMLYDIKLSNHMPEGDKVFGTIESKVIFSLTKSPSNYKYMPNEDAIIKPPIKEIRQEKKIKINSGNWFDFLPEDIDGIQFFTRIYIAIIALLFSIVLFDAINLDDSNYITIYLIPCLIFIISVLLIASSSYKRSLKLIRINSFIFLITFLNSILFTSGLIIFYNEISDINLIDISIKIFSTILIISVITINLLLICLNGNKRIN